MTFRNSMDTSAGDRSSTSIGSVNVLAVVRQGLILSDCMEKPSVVKPSEAVPRQLFFRQF